MPDEDGQGYIMLGQLADGIARQEKHLERLSHAMLGNGGDGVLTRLSHVERSATELQAKLDAIDAAHTLKYVPDEKTARSRWQAIGQIAVALAAATSLILQLL